MKVCNVTVEIFGIWPNGEVHIPWWIGTQKAKFRPFAEAVSRAIPDTIAYETPKMWVVSKHGKKLVSILELLSASPSVRSALEELNARLKDENIETPTPTVRASR